MNNINVQNWVRTNEWSGYILNKNQDPVVDTNDPKISIGIWVQTLNTTLINEN